MEESSARLEACLTRDDSSPGQKAAKAEDLRLLAAAPASLPDDQRSAIELHHFAELSVLEVAAG